MTLFDFFAPLLFLKYACIKQITSFQLFEALTWLQATINSFGQILQKPY